MFTLETLGYGRRLRFVNGSSRPRPQSCSRSCGTCDQDRVGENPTQSTAIGNNFMIRHIETTKVPVTASAHVDYLFHRMFSLVRLLLQKSGRGG
jgi:hypothetical protein